MSDCLYIVMPAYNEIENIKNVIEDWYPILETAELDSRLVIADGGSTDGTLDLLYELRQTYPRMEVLSAPGTDHGTKVLLLYRHALKKGADWVFQTDSDGQTKPDEFGEFWAERNLWDGIIGKRRNRGDGLNRIVVEFVLRVYLLLFFGRFIPDANAPFRLMRAQLLAKYIDLFPEEFDLPNAVMTECFVKYKDRVVFKDVSFQPRQGGRNYMNMKRIIRIGMGSIVRFYKIRKRLKCTMLEMRQGGK